MRSACLILDKGHRINRNKMLKTHPHAAAEYRVIALADGSIAVEVKIPDSHPTTVSPFATEADAKAWISRHQELVQSQTRPGGWFRNAQRRNGRPR